MNIGNKEKQIIDEYQKSFKLFEIEFNKILSSDDINTFKTELPKVASDFKSHFGASMIFTETAKEYYSKGEIEKAFLLFIIAAETFETIHDSETVYLRAAQYYFENSQEEVGKKYLYKLCDNLPDNYEEAFAFRELTEVWGKYCHYVNDRIAPSKSMDEPYSGCYPEECTMQIEDILKLPKDDLLLELAEHLDELSGYGDDIKKLNKWEQIAYDINALYSAISSDGIDFYLDSQCHRFAQAKKALKEVNAEKAIEFMKMVEACFPNLKVPKSQAKIEDILEDIMEADGFEDAEAFYEDEWIEKELMDAEFKFVLENREKFR